MWKMVAEEMTQQILLRDYEENEYYYAEYDFSDVRALQTDLSEIYNRLNIGVQGGWITLKEAREEVGLLTDESQDVFIRSMGTQAIPNGESFESDLETPLPPTTTPEEIISEDVETASYGNKLIKKIEDQFCVIAEESGKNMGCYPTRELAERRLEQLARFSDNPKK